MPIKGGRRPPGPKGRPIVGMALKIRRDPLNVLRTFAREYGDIVLFHVLMQERILLNHPDFVEQVLVIQQNKFHKSELTRRITGRILGQGLLTSEGDFWRRQRRLVQPAFHRGRVNEYGATMREIVQAHISRWRDGEVRDLAQEMTTLTLDNAVSTLFSTALPGEAQQVGRAMTFLMRYSLARQRSPIRIPENWPTPKNRRANRDLAFYGFARLSNDRRVEVGEEFQSPRGFALPADGRDGRRRQSHDAEAAS